ncbi:hypothetical protein TWF281_011390 [Arthrobotrys megalospora]
MAGASLIYVGPPFTMPVCQLVFDPNPDIAGRWTHIAFGLNSVFFILLGLFTPMIYSKLPQDTEKYRFTAAGRAFRPKVKKGQDQVVEAAPIALMPGEKEHIPPISLSRCLKAVSSAYRAQCVTYIAYALVGLVKSSESSPYHNNFLFATLAGQLGAGAIINFHDTARSAAEDGAAIRFESDRSRAYWLLPRIEPTIELPWVWSGRVQDNLWIGVMMLLFVSGALSFLLPRSFGKQVIRCCGCEMTPSHKSRLLRYWYIVCIVFALWTTIISQIWLIILAIRFRPARRGGGSEEDEFTFGQALVFLTWIPLFLEFLAGLTHDIKRASKGTWAGDISSGKVQDLWQTILPFLLGEFLSHLPGISRLTLLDGLWKQREPRKRRQDPSQNPRSELDIEVANIRQQFSEQPGAGTDNNTTTATSMEGALGEGLLGRRATK